MVTIDRQDKFTIFLNIEGLYGSLDSLIGNREHRVPEYLQVRFATLSQRSTNAESGRTSPTNDISALTPHRPSYLLALNNSAFHKLPRPDLHKMRHMLLAEYFANDAVIIPITLQ